MVGRHQLDPAPFVPPPAHSPHRIFCLQHVFCRGKPQGDDDLRANDLQLSLQIGRASGNFIGRGNAIPRRAAFHDVRDEDLLALQTHGGNPLIEQLARTTDKRPALQVLVLSRPFPDEDDLRIRIAFAEDRILTRLAKPALPAIVDFVVVEQSELRYLLG